MIVPKDHVACVHHGGKGGQAKKAVRERKAESDARYKLRKRMEARGKTLDNAVEEMETIAAEAIVFKDICRERLEDLGDSWRYDHQHGEQLRAEVAVYERAIDRCNKILSDYVRLGIAERKARIDEAQAVLVVTVIKDILNRLELNRDQKKLAGQVVPEALRALEGPGPRAGVVVVKGKAEPVEAKAAKPAPQGS